jgi:hypothetical protein
VVQYTDALSPTVTVTAGDADTAGSALTATASGLPNGMALSVGSTAEGSRTWTVTGTADAAPGDYPVVVTVTDDTAIARTTSFTIRVSKEDVLETYIGGTLAFTATGSATVQLRATLRDNLDSTSGNVTNATVTFKAGGTTLCTVPVGLVLTDPTTGSANCNAVLPPGSQTITAEVGGYYTGTTSAQVVVTQPTGGYMLGNGHITPTASAGVHPADPASVVSFTFYASQGKKASTPTGDVVVQFPSGGRVLAIRSSGLESVGLTTNGRAEVRARAELLDVTDPSRPIFLGDRLTLQLAATDARPGGTGDSLAITLWDGNTLLFSSGWTGVRTQEINLSGGNLLAR